MSFGGEFYSFLGQLSHLVKFKLLKKLPDQLILFLDTIRDI